MAFVFRSARDSNFDVNTATAELPLLGPGKYLGHADYTVKQRAVDAPFGITSTKFVRSSPTERCSESLSAEPSIEESRDSVSCSSIWADELKQRRQHEGRMVPFNSHGPRFRPWRAPHNIGPGEYEVPRAFGGGLIRSLSSPRVPQGRSYSSVQSGEIRNNAPSIPRPHQSYGYRESSTGDLVPYDSPSPALQGGSGLSRSMKFRFNRKDRKTQTTFGTCPRESIRSNHGGRAYPGPGYYNPGAERTGLRRFCKQHSVFTQPSCRSRGKIREQGQPTPGPGHYEAPSQGTTHTSPPCTSSSSACFGSMSRRFVYTVESSPGPGQYNTNRRTSLGAGWKFSSNCSADRADDSESSEPGPGHYVLGNLWDTGHGSLAGAKFSRTGFGSTVSRFGTRGSQRDTTGVAEAYTLHLTQKATSGNVDGARVDDLAARRKRDRKAKTTESFHPAPFCSRAKRFHSMRDATTPESSDKGLGSTMTTKALCSAEHANKLQASNGPLLHRASRKSVRSGFLSREPRFFEGNASKGSSPGPGYYYSRKAPECHVTSAAEAEKGCGSGINTGATIGFASSTRRFQAFGLAEGCSAAVSETPGPGSYTIENGWIKRTYSQLFGEVF
ncbi:hypothetical protein FOZ63_031872 [Perkinsus olseni]|uniref:Uncharacterized protein n=1 Tax=Perkinsus olseni TaxID=32597 RepID=A0A7J6Q1Q2_PEROL|nr:hypothetical protein FOZ63_031872 [Perkinsus olseni]